MHRHHKDYPVPDGVRAVYLSTRVSAVQSFRMAIVSQNLPSVLWTVGIDDPRRSTGRFFPFGQQVRGRIVDLGHAAGGQVT